MSIAPEEVRAPARDAVVFRSSPGRTFLAVLLVVMVAYVAVSPLAARMFGADDPWWSTVAQAGIIGVLVAGAIALSARSSLATWVRISEAGLELAAQESDPVMLTWADIRHVTVRREGARTMLDVTPVDLDSVHPVEGGERGPGWPAMTETEHGTAFTADLTQIWPGPRALRRELTRRMHPEHDPGTGRARRPGRGRTLRSGSGRPPAGEPGR